MQTKDKIFHERKYSDLTNKFNAENLLSNSRLKIFEIFENKVEKISGNILDIGAGTGYASIFILKNFNNVNVTSLDISPNSCTLAKKYAEHFKLENKLNIINSDLYDYSPKNKFDLIVSFGTLHHADCLFSFVKKISELLVEGGHLLCSEPTQSNFTTNSEYIKKYNTAEIKYDLELKNFERDDHFFREAEYIVSASFNNLDLIYLDDLKKNKSFYKKFFNKENGTNYKEIKSKILIFKKNYHEKIPHKWKNL